jgi:hypothetical protein
MKQEEIERALRTEKTVTPSPDFAHRVMRAVRAEADANRGLEFPWRWLAAGLAACAALIAAGVMTGARGVELDALSLSPAAIQATMLVPVSLAVSFLLVWWSRRLA